MRHETGLQSFVRGLIAGHEGRRAGEQYRLDDGSSAQADIVAAMIADGSLSGDAARCRASGETRAWLKRALLDADAFAAQHRVSSRHPEGGTINLTESPLARLGLGPAPFLAAHHLEAGERIRRLVERAQLQPRVTMSYSASHAAGSRRGGQNDISDMAAQARRTLAEVHAVLPADCASAVIDICGFLKGLQDVERDNGWPRRSAKLVLRIGLEQLALHFGIGEVATGREIGHPQAWMGEGARPTSFG